ncbi:MAG: acyltransferase domain-containing protein [Acutalibacteraceae bacterium]
MTHNTSHFQKVMDVIELSEEEKQYFNGILNKIEADTNSSAEFDSIYNDFLFPEVSSLNGILPRLTELGEKNGIHEYSIHFLFLLVCTEELLKLYKKNNIDEKLFWDFCDDLRCKYIECKNVKGVYGTFVAWWNTMFYKLERFALGRFQYEFSQFKHEDTTLDCGVVIKRGDKTLNFHIPSSNKPFSQKDRIESYKTAYNFFKDYVREDGLIIFECSSWLLYKGNLQILPENSNIRSFINDFNLISSEEKENFGDAWRVFGKSAELPPEQWDENTTLQRAFKKHILNGGKTGAGYGVVVFDGEKIVK